MHFRLSIGTLTYQDKNVNYLIFSSPESPFSLFPAHTDDRPDTEFRS